MSPKDHSNFLVLDPKDMEIWDSSDKEFKIGFFKETQWDTRKHKKKIQQNSENNT